MAIVADIVGAGYNLALGRGPLEKEIYLLQAVMVCFVRNGKIQARLLPMQVK